MPVNSHVINVKTNRVPPKAKALVTPANAVPGQEITGDEESSQKVIIQAAQKGQKKKRGGVRRVASVEPEPNNTVPCMACAQNSRWLQHASWCEKAPR
jgi:hypothetical protein